LIRPVVLAVSVAATSCHCGAAAEERAEAERVLYAIDRVRSAEANVRAPLLDALARTPASRPAHVRARDACVRAYRELGQASALSGALPTAAPAGSSIPLELVHKLLAAEQAAGAARESLGACEQAVADVRRALTESR
jgi:hypothetical protein